MRKGWQQHNLAYHDRGADCTTWTKHPVGSDEGVRNGSDGRAQILGAFGRESQRSAAALGVWWRVRRKGRSQDFWPGQLEAWCFQKWEEDHWEKNRSGKASNEIWGHVKFWCLYSITKQVSDVRYQTGRWNLEERTKLATQIWDSSVKRGYWKPCPKISSSREFSVVRKEKSMGWVVGPL